jgi:putative addiction module CopG family antidote
MRIQLKPEQEKFIQEKIASGEYSNADDVIYDAFKLLETRKSNISEIEDRKNFLENANQAYIALRNNSEAWRKELAERELWEQTIADGVVED